MGRYVKKVWNYGNFWFVFLLSNYIPIPILIAAQDSDEEHASNRRAYDQQFDAPLLASSFIYGGFPIIKSNPKNSPLLFKTSGNSNRHSKAFLYSTPFT